MVLSVSVKLHIFCVVNYAVFTLRSTQSFSSLQVSCRNYLLPLYLRNRTTETLELWGQVWFSVQEYCSTTISDFIVLCVDNSTNTITQQMLATDLHFCRVVQPHHLQWDCIFSSLFKQGSLWDLVKKCGNITAYCFSVKVRIIWGQQFSNNKSILNTISQRNFSLISHLICLEVHFSKCKMPVDFDESLRPFKWFNYKPL